MSGLPESLRAARRWDRIRDNYAAFGLCNKCAAQAAWGHANGWGDVDSPCDRCAELITALPVPQAEGWRSVRRGDAPWQTWPSAASKGDSLTASA